MLTPDISMSYKCLDDLLSVNLGGVIGTKLREQICLLARHFKGETLRVCHSPAEDIQLLSRLSLIFILNGFYYEKALTLLLAIPSMIRLMMMGSTKFLAVSIIIPLCRNSG